LHLHVLVTLSQTSTSYTNNSDNTLPMLNIDTKLPLIPNKLPAPEFKIGSQVYVKAQFSIQHDLPRKLSYKFLGPYEILALPGTHSVTLRLPGQSPSCTPGIPHLNVGTSNPKSDFPIGFNPTPANHCRR